MAAIFDYFAFTLHVTTGEVQDAADLLCSCLASMTADDGEPGPGMYWYTSTVRFPGSLVAWGGQYQVNTVFVSITGSGCALGSLDDFRHLLRTARTRGTVAPKRFDLAADAPTFQPYYAINQNMEDFLISNRVQKLRKVEEYQVHEGLPANKISGTMYFGSRQSPRMTRVYMKTITDEEEVEHRVTRIEIEAKEGWAVRVLELFDQGHTPGFIMASLARDYIDVEQYVQVSDETGIHEGSVKLTYPRKQRARSVAVWLLSVAGCVEDVRQVYGDQFIRDLALLGWSKRGRVGTRPGAERPPVSNTGVQLDFDLDLVNLLLSRDDQGFDLQADGVG